MAPDTAELARGYIASNDTQFGAGLFLLDRLKVQPGMRVLDVGCGPGNLTAHLALLVGPAGNVVGVDPSGERIALAQQLAKPGSLEFHEGRAEDLSRFPDASFDAVFVNSTFHWVADQPGAMREFARVLKPGGRVGLSGSSGDFEADLERIKADVLAREPFKGYPEEDAPKFLGKKEMERLLDAAGFVDRDMVVNKIYKEAKDGDAMIAWLDASSSGKTYGGIPLEMRPQAREQMKKEWDKITTEDGIRMELQLLVTVATKG